MHTWQIPPPTRAVTIGGRLRATGVDSQVLFLRLGLEVIARVDPHMGGVNISVGIGSIIK